MKSMMKASLTIAAKMNYNVSRLKEIRNYHQRKRNGLHLQEKKEYSP